MYQAFDQIVFRFPHYPLEVIKKALSQKEYFQEMIRSDFFEEAIYFASPDLYEELQKYKAGKIKEKDYIRVENALFKYLARMSSRCTPFGLFSSCATGEKGDLSEVLLTHQVNIHVRFDMLYLCNLSQELGKLPEVRKIVKYYTNTTLYTQATKIRYIEYRFDTEKRIYQLVEVSNTPYLRDIIKIARKGCTFAELIKFLTATGEVSEEIARSYIDTIIDNQLLVSEIDPIITGSDFFEHILKVIERLDTNSEYYQKLSRVNRLLQKLPFAVPSEVIALCNQIEEEVKQLHIPFQKKFLLQVDTIRKLEKATLDNTLLTTLQDSMEFLNKITPRYTNNTLTNFIKCFSERYEEQEIPLLEALDPERGIGYPAHEINDLHPLLGGLIIPGRVDPNASLQTNLFPIHQILLKKLVTFNPQTDQEILLSDKDVKNLQPNWEDLPATMFTKFQILNFSENPRDYTLVVNNFNGSSAANLLGRFVYCDPSIQKLVENIARKEQEIYKDQVVAEISHIPDSRVGNVLARPNFREYEILYLANSTLERKRILYPADLFLSVRNNRLLLRSQRLNKYIIPRLSTAHNYRNNPTPVYRFLCDLQSQGVRASLLFSWGSIEQQLEYLPRVRYKNIILSEANWKISVKSLENLIKETDSKKLMEEVRNWQTQLKLPRFVFLADGDNKLLIDLESRESIRVFLNMLSNRRQITLEEALCDHYALTKDTEGFSYMHECIVSFYKS